MALVTGDEFTKTVLKRYEDIPNPRLREVMQAAVKHLHAFVSEVKPNGEEWFKAIQYLTAIGQKCDDRRQEFILLSDTLGVSMLVDDINNRRVAGATPSTVEGPFHVADSPEFADGTSMAGNAPGIPCFVVGTVRGLDGKPVGGAMLDLWQTDGEGFYEAQRDVTEPWMRGLYKTRPDGSYVIRTVAPIGYTIPMDGPVGELVKKTSISPMRPAHIHFCLESPGYHRVVTHLFQRGCPYIETDVVYGVKEPLIVDFVEKPAGVAPNGEKVDTPFYVINYDFVLQKSAAKAAAA